MTVEELDANERRAFLVWRRNLARLVPSCTLVSLCFMNYPYIGIPCLMKREFSCQLYIFRDCVVAFDYSYIGIRVRQVILCAL